MSSCFGSRKNRTRLDDREPLLPVYHDDTELQRRLHQKLHSYQMFRALSLGSMPSNEQLIINLRTLLASDVLNPATAELSDSGRLLVRYARQFLQQFIDALGTKNAEDQLQDFVWFMRKADFSVDTADLSRKASKLKAKADTAAAYTSIQTIGSLLLTNSDFRIFLRDLQTVGKNIFQDSAFAVSKAAEDVGKQVAPSDAEQQKLAEPGADGGPAPSTQDLAGEVKEVSKAIGDEAIVVGKVTQESVETHFSGGEKETLLYRLKQAVLKLRQRPDYSDSVSTISLLIQRYAMVYSRAAEQVIDTAQENVDTSPELDYATQCLWKLAKSFGDVQEWEELEARFRRLAQHANRNPDFERVMGEISGSVEKILSDPDFVEHADEKFVELREKSRETFGADSTMKADGQALIDQVKRTVQSVVRDKDVQKLMDTSSRLANVLSPNFSTFNAELFEDCVNTFVPMLLNAIQYIPIPRLEISHINFDLLLENLILEPGNTINKTSFLPFRLRAETYNNIEIRRTHTLRTASTVKSTFTIKIDGLSVRGEEIGFWLRARSGFLSFADEGLASFELDERGVDIHLDVEVGREQLEHILTLKAVRVHIHKFNYNLRQSKFACIAWLLKPLLRPTLRNVLQKQIAQAVADFFHAANRELLFARERLRATRIADPNDVLTFFKAVLARLTPAEDPDLYTRVGVRQPGEGVFKGVYAPGSLVRMWEEEARQAAERVEDFQRGGWRNDIFDVSVRPANSVT